MSVRFLKAKTGLLWVAALLALGVTGCASSGRHSAVANGCGHGDTGVALARNRAADGPTYPWTWGAGRGSVVSPLGDAPGERDLDTSGNWGLDRCACCNLCMPTQPGKSLAGKK
jgi:hypothetical protein